MTWTMYDAVTPSNIPVNAEGVAGYVDGHYAWKLEDWARFAALPRNRCLRIAVFPSTNDGDVLDCETGDATPSQCPAWIRMRQASGLAVPTIYCNTSTEPQVRAACSGLTYDVWTAHYTQQAHIEPRSGATQYADPGPVDISLCEDWWPRSVTPAPVFDNGLLRLGSSGPAVTTLQARLGCTVDGDFGPVTLAAVEAFQRAHSLTVDGIVGPLTQAALDALVLVSTPIAVIRPAPVVPLPPIVPIFPGTTQQGSKSDAVRQVQARLAARGWHLSVDGDFGPATRVIVVAFQSQKGLSADGIVGPKTWAALWLTPIT